MNIELTAELLRRVKVYAALADPARLAIVDALALGDKSPSELSASLGVISNLLAHHVGVLDRAGILVRTRSEGDRRRSYLQLVPGAAQIWGPAPHHDADRLLFVCRENSARSQLAAALWIQHSDVPATSAGTHPAARVHPRAVQAARRHRLPPLPDRPRHLAEVRQPGDLVIAVCDQTHEELEADPARMHWSIPDPAASDNDAAFDQTVEDLTDRITRLTPAIHPQPSRGEAMTDTSYKRKDLSIDQQLALRTAATNLQRQFQNVFGTETIERLLNSTYDEFASRASIPNYLPLLAERFARQRLRALAKVEGLSVDTRPTVLFLCTHNAGRSQMAMGFFKAFAGDLAVVWSGGSEPGNAVNPAAVAAMAERGIDISDEYPKPWTDEIVRAADVVITMGCGDACPLFPGKRYEEWVLDDPAGMAVEDVQPIRDDIEQRVRRLLAELNVPVGSL